MTLEFPPMPQVKDFVINEIVLSVKYEQALAAWERVCTRLIEAWRETDDDD